MILLKILFFSFLIYYVIKAIGRILLPPALRNIARNMDAQSKRHSKKKPEGEVTIQNLGDKSNNKIRKDVGEYTDFEELPEDA